MASVLPRQTTPGDVLPKECTDILVKFANENLTINNFVPDMYPKISWLVLQVADLESTKGNVKFTEILGNVLKQVQANPDMSITVQAKPIAQQEKESVETL